MPRTFEDLPAVRERVPLLLGLVGPSGSGKTFSALRLAAGIQRETGGEVFGIDTEARRMRHYADIFRFRHVEFNAPFGPLDYLAAIEHCTAKGAGVVIVDSISHEHEGPGGVLEMHEAELQRLAGGDLGKRERVNFLAWVRPKAERRRLINTLLQLNANFIFCFRAKEKMKIKKGEEPVPLGWQAIGGEEFVYEMTMSLLLPPACAGVPNLAPIEIGERALLKIPQQFRGLLKPGEALSEDLGAQLARWAAGDEHAVLLSSIQERIGAAHPGADAASKAAKAALLHQVLGVGSWKEAKALDLDRLRLGLAALPVVGPLIREPAENGAEAEPAADPPGGDAPVLLGPERAARLRALAEQAGVLPQLLADTEARFGTRAVETLPAELETDLLRVIEKAGASRPGKGKR